MGDLASVIGFLGSPWMTYTSNAVVLLFVTWAINDVRLNGRPWALSPLDAPPQLAAPADGSPTGALGERLPFAEWSALLKDCPFPEAGAESLLCRPSEALEWPYLAYLAGRELPEDDPLLVRDLIVEKKKRKLLSEFMRDCPGGHRPSGLCDFDRLRWWVAQRIADHERDGGSADAE